METRTFFTFLSYYRLLIIALILMFFSTVLIQLNYNKNHMKDFTVDEYYTITSVHPDFDPTNTIHRALNGPRMFTYLFYPGALVGMIGHMGGNIYTEGWDYPGHNYFIENYKLHNSRAAENVEDPNFRYLRYYLKLQAIILVFLTLIPLVLYLWKKKYYVAMFMMATLIGINFLALEERSLFYIEPLLLAMINLLLWLYLYLFDKKKISVFWIILSALMISVSASLKFSCLFFIILLGILIVVKPKNLERRIQNLTLLVVFSALFFFLINWNILYSKEVFNEVVHDYFSNFWQYATGAKTVILQNYRADNFRGVVHELFSSFGSLVYLLPLVFIYGLTQLGKSERLKWGAVVLVVLISVIFIVNQRVYIDRNILPFLPAIVLVTGVMLDSILSRFEKTGIFDGRYSRMAAYLLLFTLVFLPVWIFTDNYFQTLFPNAKSKIERSLASIEGLENRRLLAIDFNPGTAGANYASVSEIPSFPETYGTMLKKEALKTTKEFLTTDVVILKEINNNKQLTNYILPKLFNSNEQFASFFLFYNDPNKDQEYLSIKRDMEQSDSENLLSESISLREDLLLEEVRISKAANGYRLFLRLEFSDVLFGKLKGCRFYIHTRPFDADLEKLPEDRKKHGFEGWGFTLSEKNLFRFGNETYVFGDIDPVLKSYKNLSFGIFRGCAESEDIIIENVLFP